MKNVGGIDKILRIVQVWYSSAWYLLGRKHCGDWLVWCHY